jgi:hypothetical protein
MIAMEVLDKKLDRLGCGLYLEGWLWQGLVIGKK